MKELLALSLFLQLPVFSTTLVKFEIDRVWGELPSSFQVGDEHELFLEASDLLLSGGPSIVLVDSEGGVLSGGYIALEAGSLLVTFDSSFPGPLSTETLMSQFSGTTLSGVPGHRETMALEGMSEGGYAEFELSGSWGDATLEGFDGLLADSSSFVAASGSYRWSEFKRSVGVPLSFPQPEYFGVDFRITSVSIVPELSTGFLSMFGLLSVLLNRSRKV